VFNTSIFTDYCDSVIIMKEQLTSLFEIGLATSNASTHETTDTARQ